MKRHSLLFVTLFTLLLTGGVLPHTGWLTSRSAHASPSHGAETHGHARSRDPLASDAAWRWRQCQPTHWRACLLQH
jgi:hypothetical protein